MAKGKLLVISGPSGSGKDTILAMFCQKHPDWESPLSTTTRQPRPGEVNGEDMNFVSRDEFQEMAREGKFLEYFEVADNLYGTLREPVESLLHSDKNVVLRKDVQGALEIKKLMPEATIAIIVPDSEVALEERLRTRASDSESVINRRLAIAKDELATQDMFDHVIINPQGKPEQALADLEKALNL